jgi:glycyl-tRNA synthetase
MNKYKFDVIVNHLQTYGFIYQGSEIYDGLANSWDYGPLGVELNNNLKRMWWKKFVQETTTNVGIDSAIFMNPKVWEATGHVSTFNDPLIDCKSCKMRFRADQLVDQIIHDKEKSHDLEAIKIIFKEGKITCPNCGNNQFTDIRKFNMMFKTHLGPSEDSQSLVYLRPETAQGIFVNFKNIMRTTRRKIPFGVASIGKAFRNEITTGNFTFRTREFTQLELEFFCKPDSNEQWFKYWKEYAMNFLFSIGISSNNLRFRDHDKNELAFYSQATSDIEYHFPFGWDEIWGIADRGDYDLKQHQKYSGKQLDYLDPDTNEKYIPFVIEPSLGLDRLALSSLVEAYDEEQLTDDTRVVLHLHPALAPYKVAVLPLSRQLNEKAIEVVNILNKHFMVVYDETGSIGKRYRRQDAIGTPFCITIDFDTSKEQTVTIRERDSMKQIRLPIDELIKYLTIKVYY